MTHHNTVRLRKISNMLHRKIGLNFGLCCFRASGPINGESLRNKVTVGCRRTEDQIMKTWFSKVLILLTSNETLQGVKAERLDSFYNCVSTLISNQVR